MFAAVDFYTSVHNYKVLIVHVDKLTTSLIETLHFCL